MLLYSRHESSFARCPLNHFEIPAALGGVPRLQHRHRVGNQRGQADFGALARQVFLADFAGFLVLIAEIVVQGAGDVAFLLVVHGQQEILEAVVARAGNQRHIALCHPRGDFFLPALPALAQIRRMRRIRRNQPPARFPDCPLNPPGIQVVIHHADGNAPQLRYFLYAEVVQCASPPCSPCLRLRNWLPKHGRRSIAIRALGQHVGARRSFYAVDFPAYKGIAREVVGRVFFR